MQRIVWVLAFACAGATYADSVAPAELTLSAAVERALRASPRLVAARQRARSAQAEVAMAQAMLRPHLSAGAVSGVSDREVMLDAAGSAGPTPGAMLGRQATAQVVAAAMMPVYTGGGLEAQLRRAQSMAAAVEAELQAEITAVVADVKEAFYRAQYSAAMLRAAEADRAAAHAMVENARAEWEAGRGIEASFLRAVARERASERSIAAARSARAAAIIALTRAMGEQADAPIELAEEPPASAPFGDVESAVRAALGSSPRLRAAQRREAAVRHAADAAHAARRPQVYASVMGGVSSRGGMDGTETATIGLSAVWPLYDGDMRANAVHKAEADRLASRAEADSERLAVVAEVRTAWSELEAADASLAASEAAVNAAKAAYGVIELRAQNQKAILVEQLDALAAVREAEEAVARARFERQLAIVRIERAAGRLP